MSTKKPVCIQNQKNTTTTTNKNEEKKRRRKRIKTYSNTYDSSRQTHVDSFTTYTTTNKITYTYISISIGIYTFIIKKKPFTYSTGSSLLHVIGTNVHTYSICSRIRDFVQLYGCVYISFSLNIFFYFFFSLRVQ